MKILHLKKTNLKEIINSSIKILKTGGIIAYPTETFYAIGAKYNIETALNKIYKIKQRSLKKPMPLIIGNIKQLSMLTNNIDVVTTKLIKKFWPGPLTILFKANKELSKYIVSNGKVAIRIPGKSYAFFLSKSSQFPITSTSANISLLPAAMNAQEIISYFKDNIDLIIETDDIPNTLPSTIIEIVNNKIKVLRQGTIQI